MILCSGGPRKPICLFESTCPSFLSSHEGRLVVWLLTVPVKLLSCVWLFVIPWSLPGYPIHGIFQARVLEWVAISFSRGSSWPRDWTQYSHIAGRHFTVWSTRGALSDSWIPSNMKWPDSTILETKIWVSTGSRSRTICNGGWQKLKDTWNWL